MATLPPYEQPGGMLPPISRYTQSAKLLPKLAEILMGRYPILPPYEQPGQMQRPFVPPPLPPYTQPGSSLPMDRYMQPAPAQPPTVPVPAAPQAPVPRPLGIAPPTPGLAQGDPSLYPSIEALLQSLNLQQPQQAAQEPMPRRWVEPWLAP